MVRNNSSYKMETSLYDDMNHRINNDMNRLKRNLTLDLNFTNINNNSKRPKFSPMVLGAPVLSSPDVKMLKLTSPEIEKFILSQHGNLLITPTPSTPHHTTLLFPKSVSDEHDLYTQGFADALNELNNTDSSHSASSVEQKNSIPSGYVDFPASLASNYGIVFSPGNDSVMVKEESQIVPSLESSPPLSPINMESQERIKLERKRMRNRVAASKCRRRKLERIAKLEDKVRALKGENTELSGIVIRLKDEVCKLKQNVLEHVQSGCQIIVSSSFYAKPEV